MHGCQESESVCTGADFRTGITISIIHLFWFKYVFIAGKIFPKEVKLDKGVQEILPVLFCWLSYKAPFSLIKADCRALAKVVLSAILDWSDW